MRKLTWLCPSGVHSTQAVRIGDDHFRHPECYTCSDCGLNLKMRGHFWVGNVMYCEKHAKERYQGPEAPFQWPCLPANELAVQILSSFWTKSDAWNNTSPDSLIDFGMFWRGSLK